MPLITKSIPMKPLIDDTYTRIVSLNSNNTRQDYQDFILASSVDPERCAASVDDGLRHYRGDLGNYGLGFLAEIINADTLRLWVGGRAEHDTLSNYTFDLNIIIYEFGRKPKRIETVKTTGNAFATTPETVMLSSPVDLSKSVILNAAAGGLLYRVGICDWIDNQSLAMRYTIGCNVVEF